jgi:nucleoside-diphosphate-sugar epimerase
MRCVIEGKDIVLDTEGLTERSYLYTADAVSAIILAMLNATPGKAYSVANPETYCSIREMANTVAREVADGNIAVKVNRKENSKEKGYADTLYMDLDVSAMEELGWYPVTDISTMFRRMIRGTKEDVQSIFISRQLWSWNHYALVRIILPPAPPFSNKVWAAAISSNANTLLH